MELKNCPCGGKVRMINPLEIDNNRDRFVFCDTCTGVWCLAVNLSIQDLTEAWNEHIKGE